MTASLTATDEFRRRSASSSLLPPVASLYPSYEPHSAIPETTRISHPTENQVSANESMHKPSDDLGRYGRRDIASWDQPIDDNYQWDHRTSGYKRKWSESNSSSPGQVYGLHKTDIDVIIDCATDINNTLVPSTIHASMHHAPRSMPSSPVASMISPDENSIIGTNGQFLGLEEGDLDRLVHKASQVVEIFERAKKQLNSGSSSIHSNYSLSSSNSEQPMIQHDSMEELAEISSQRRAIAMAGARSKPDLGTSSISMFRYADHSKKKHKRAGTEKLQCHSCKSTETPEWRKGPMGSRTLCNACGLIWAKLARKKNQIGDQDRWAGDSIQSRTSSIEDQMFQHTSESTPQNTQLNSSSPTHSSLEKLQSPYLPDGHGGSESRNIFPSMGNTSPEPKNTMNNHTRTDKFKLSFLLD